MGKPIKLLVGGVGLGIMVILALVGAKSLFDDHQSKQQSGQSQNPQIAIAAEADSDAVLPDLQIDSNADTIDPADQGAISIEPQAPTDSSDVANANTANPQQAKDITEETKIELVDEQGHLQVALVDPNDPARTPNAYIVVRDAQGKQVASRGNTRTATFDLPEGDYRVLASVRGKQVQRMVAIYEGETSDVLLELALSPPRNQSQPPTQAQTPAQKPIPQPQQNTSTQQVNQSAQTAQGGTGRLDMRILEADTQRPVKANIYVQRTNGVHVANKKYVDSSVFTLPVGTYKVTVKAKGKQDLIRTVRILQNKGLRQNFVMLAAGRSAPPVTQTQTPPRQTTQQTPVKPAPTQPAVANGTLRLHAVSGVDGSPFPVNFRVTTLDGQVLHRIRRSAFAEVTVPANDVWVHIRYRGMRGKERIRINANQPTTYTFTVTPNTQQPAGQAGQVPYQQPQQAPQNLPQQPDMEQLLKDFLNRL